MKRCPICHFPNIDTDRTCFKCNAILTEEVNIAYPNSEEKAYLAYGKSLSELENTLNDSHTPPPSDTSDYTAPPTPSTRPPRQTTPTRIIPKYASFSLLTTLLRLLSSIQGLLFIILGVMSALTLKNTVGILILVVALLLGVASILIGFTLSYLLVWFNDVECNQRKQLELLTHIFHKIDK